MSRYVSNARIDRFHTGAEIESVGSKMILASASDLLGLGVDRRVQEAVEISLNKVGFVHSRSLSLIDGLEAKAAKLMGCPHVTVVSQASAAFDLWTRIAVDERSLQTGLGGTATRSPDVLVDSMAHHPYDAVVSEAVYPLEGDLAPLARYAEICNQHRIALVAVDRRALGVLGSHGGGAVDQLRLTGEIDLQISYLGESIAGSGALVGGAAQLVEVIRQTSDPPPAPCLAATLKCIELSLEEPNRRARSLDVAQYLNEGLRARRFDVGPSVTPWISVWIGDETLCEQWLRALAEHGVACRGLICPSKSRLLLAMSATSTDEQLDVVLHAFDRVRRKLRVPEMDHAFDSGASLARPGIYAVAAPCAAHWHAVETPSPGFEPTSRRSLGDRLADTLETLTWRASAKIPGIRLARLRQLTQALSKKQPRE